MSEFFSDAAANLVGTFVGAGLALLTAGLVSRHERTVAELDKLQRLVDRIYRSRALTEVPREDRRTAILNEAQRADFERVTSAVFMIRKLIEDAANEFNTRSGAASVLDGMYMHVLDYLNAVEIDNRDYVNDAMRLRDALFREEEGLRLLHPQLVVREPGGIGNVRPSRVG